MACEILTLSSREEPPPRLNLLGSEWGPGELTEPISLTAWERQGPREAPTRGHSCSLTLP